MFHTLLPNQEEKLEDDLPIMIPFHLAIYGKVYVWIWGNHLPWVLIILSWEFLCYGWSPEIFITNIWYNISPPPPPPPHTHTLPIKWGYIFSWKGGTRHFNGVFWMKIYEFEKIRGWMVSNPIFGKVPVIISFSDIIFA